jgi:hypothetical protein
LRRAVSGGRAEKVLAAQRKSMVGRHAVPARWRVREFDTGVLVVDAARQVSAYGTGGLPGRQRREGWLPVSPSGATVSVG